MDQILRLGLNLKHLRSRQVGVVYVAFWLQRYPVEGMAVAQVPLRQESFQCQGLLEAVLVAQGLLLSL